MSTKTQGAFPATRKRRRRQLLRRAFCLAAVLLAGCAPSSEFISKVDPDGGPSRVFNKPYELVYAAAARVMTDQGATFRQASLEKGRIITTGKYEIARGIFFIRLPLGQTRVEFTRNLAGNGVASYPGGSEGFFTALKEQFVVFEKYREVKKEQARQEAARRRVGAGINPSKSEDDSKLRPDPGNFRISPGLVVPPGFHMPR